MKWGRLGPLKKSLLLEQISSERSRTQLACNACRPPARPACSKLGCCSCYCERASERCIFCHSDVAGVCTYCRGEGGSPRSKWVNRALAVNYANESVGIVCIRANLACFRQRCARNSVTVQQCALFKNFPLRSALVAAA